MKRGVSLFGVFRHKLEDSTVGRLEVDIFDGPLTKMMAFVVFGGPKRSALWCANTEVRTVRKKSSTRTKVLGDASTRSPKKSRVDGINSEPFVVSYSVVAIIGAFFSYLQKRVWLVSYQCGKGKLA